MITTRHERRQILRKRVLRMAYIVLSDRAPKLECTVQDLSDAGASLRVSTTFGLPGSFDLVTNSKRYRCHARWRTDNKIGVVFEPVPTAA